MHYRCNTLENALEREDFWKQTCIALGTLRQKQKFSKDFNTLKWREKKQSTPGATEARYQRVKRSI